VPSANAVGRENTKVGTDEISAAEVCFFAMELAGPQAILPPLPGEPMLLKALVGRSIDSWASA
jgi:hypothetical protein